MSSETSPPAPKAPVKPGYQTTEFWMMLVVVIGGALSTVYAEAEWAKALGLIISGLVALGYGRMRALSKGEHTAKVENHYHQK